MKNIFILFLILFYTTIFAQQTNSNPSKHYDYIGSLGGLKIGMTLVFNNKQVTGTYFYANQLRDFPLEGTLDDGRNIILIERDDRGNIKARFTGHFPEKDSSYGNSLLEHEVIEGLKSKPDGSKSEKFRILMEGMSYVKSGENRYYVAGFYDDSAVETFAQTFKNAVINKDKNTVASMIDYPIGVTINNKRVIIKNQANMLKNYDQIFHPVFYTEIKAAIPHNMFTRYDGVMFGDRGEIWFGSVNNKIVVTAINNEKSE